MAEIHFIGEIKHAVATELHDPHISVTWALVPGNAAWSIRAGYSFGETQVCKSSIETGKAILNHPIDIQFETSSSEGWPVFVCEIWDKTHDSAKSFVGCGSAWLPTSPGEHSVDVFLWCPRSVGSESITGELLFC